MGKRVFISADHGLAIVYFLQSDIVPTLIESDVEVKSNSASVAPDL